MIHNDEITQELNELLNKHPEFHKLYANDPTVHSWLKTAMTYNDRKFVDSTKEVLIGVIVALGADKERLFDQNVMQMRQCTCNTVRVKL